MRIRIISVCALFAICLTSGNFIVCAQSPVPQKPCSAPEASQFDFWVGEWDLTWNDTITGTNVITKELDGCVIHENFSAPSNSFKGKSYSVYNPKQGVWKQTWVDNQGSYLDFTGGLEGDKMILKRSFVGPMENTVIQRMVYFNISQDSLDWSWESSQDDGKTWKQNWLIHYKRAK
jgi:hypothetical protein